MVHDIVCGSHRRRGTHLLDSLEWDSNVTIPQLARGYNTQSEVIDHQVDVAFIAPFEIV